QCRDVGRLRALGPLHCLELHLVALLQRLEAAAGDGAEMDEEIVSTSVGRDEAETLRVVEPLHRSGCHKNTSPPSTHERVEEGAKRSPILVLAACRVPRSPFGMLCSCGRIRPRVAARRRYTAQAVSPEPLRAGCHLIRSTG